MEVLLALLALIIVIGLLVLPIVAIVRTGRIRDLEHRLQRLEAAFARAPAPLPVEVPEPAPAPAPPPPTAAPPTPTVPPAPVPTPAFVAIEPPSAEHLELVIGRRWIGLVAIALIVVATAFFLKYAFENRWIGELGRVTLGVVAGLTLVWGGYKRHGRRWRSLSEVLTGGGIVILYLSVYGAFAYYHLVDQRTAFIFLAILVAEAHLLAMEYDAPSIAVLALIGGFLVPLLLTTGRDQYRVLFTYIGLLDVGMLGVVIARSWRWIGSLAYLGTQFLFWGWYSEHYHPEKRLAALLFQTAIFLIFAGADLAPNLRGRMAGWEECVRLAVNPFVFYAICYGLLNDDYHDWMAALALLLATAYAALARAQLSLCRADRPALLVTLGTALTFVTLAIPIQLDANWITMAWGVEALLILWAARETGALTLRWFSGAVFALALVRFLFIDTPWGYRAPTSRRFLTATSWECWPSTACLAGAAYLYRAGCASGPSAEDRTGWRSACSGWGRVSKPTAISPRSAAAIPAHGRGLPRNRAAPVWAGQLSLSLLWSAYAGLLTATGFRWRLRPLRVAGPDSLRHHAVKVLLVDMSELRQFYRIVALLILGLVLLGVAWKYQRSLRREQTL